MDRKHKSHFTEENILINNKHMQRCSISVATKEMCIKTTVSDHYVSLKTAKIKIVTTSKASEDVKE